jgi:hypothetical protein
MAAFTKDREELLPAKSFIAGLIVRCAVGPLSVMAFANETATRRNAA